MLKDLPKVLCGFSYRCCAPHFRALRFDIQTAVCEPRQGADDRLCLFVLCFMFECVRCLVYLSCCIVILLRTSAASTAPCRAPRLPIHLCCHQHQPDTKNERKKSHEALVTWRPEVRGKFRGSLAFKMDGRFPAQVSVVGEAVDVGGRSGGGGNRRKSDAREGRKKIKGAPVGAGGSGKRRSSSQEASSRGTGPSTLVRLCEFR